MRETIKSSSRSWCAWSSKVFMLVGLLYASACSAEKISLVIESAASENPFVITATLENVSEEPLVLPLLFIPEDYYIRFNITEKGSSDRLRFSGTTYDWIESPKDYLRIFPTSKYSQEIDLSKFYDMDNDKCYNVEAIYEVADYQREEDFLWFGRVKSNNLRINCDH